MQFGIIGSGSWGTALAKMLTDNDIHINWCVRSENTMEHLLKRHHNPNYLTTVSFNTSLLSLSVEPRDIIHRSDHIVIVTPSAFVTRQFSGISAPDLEGKKIISAVKGILPQHNQLLNDYLASAFNFNIDNYITIMGPCHAEEVAAERL